MSRDLSGSRLGAEGFGFGGGTRAFGPGECPTCPERMREAQRETAAVSEGLSAGASGLASQQGCASECR